MYKYKHCKRRLEELLSRSISLIEVAPSKRKVNIAFLIIKVSYFDYYYNWMHHFDCFMIFVWILFVFVFMFWIYLLISLQVNSQIILKQAKQIILTLMSYACINIREKIRIFKKNLSGNYLFLCSKYFY